MNNPPKIELRNIKHSRSLSEETNAFAATIYVDGKKAGTASNHGTGGPDDYHFEDRAVQKRCEDYCKSLPPVNAYGTELKMDLEMFIGQLVEDDLNAKERLRIANLFKKWCSKETMFRLKGDKPDGFRKLAIPISDPRARPYLVTKYGDKVEEILNDTIADPAKLKAKIDGMFKKMPGE